MSSLIFKSKKKVSRSFTQNNFTTNVKLKTKEIYQKNVVNACVCDKDP